MVRVSHNGRCAVRLMRTEEELLVLSGKIRRIH